MSTILVLNFMFSKLINMSLKKLFSLRNSGDDGWSLSAQTSVFFETPGATSIKWSSISGTCIPLEFIIASMWDDVSDPCSRLHVLEANKHVFEKALQFAKFRRQQMEFQGTKIGVFFFETPGITSIKQSSWCLDQSRPPLQKSNEHDISCHIHVNK